MATLWLLRLVGNGQRSLACCNTWGCKESDTTNQLNWTDPHPSSRIKASKVLSGKESGPNRILGFILVLGRSPGEGNGNPLQYSCWEIPWAWWAMVHGGLKNVRHNLVTKQQQQKSIHWQLQSVSLIVFMQLEWTVMGKKIDWWELNLSWNPDLLHCK